jgi:uncharacterized oxidoreductase
MNLSNNTVLITGGSSGIGAGLAAALVARDNIVIVTGRDPDRLSRLQREIPCVYTIKSDVTDSEAVASLCAETVARFPNLNVLINNAGIMRKIDLQGPAPDPVELTREVDTNLIAPIRIVQQFLPHLGSRPSAAIVNVSSALAFVPFPISPIYSATKAALHSFTQSLRVQLEQTRIKVFELIPPGTDTPLFSGDFDPQDTAGITPMSVYELVRRAVVGLERDELEIRPGFSNVLRLMSRVAPRLMLNQLAKSAKRMNVERRT